MPPIKRFGYTLICLAALLLAGTIISVQAYLGDLNLDNLVNSADFDLVRQAFGSNEWGGYPNWNPFADFDLSGIVDTKDLAIAGRSYGSDRNFHYPRQVSNSTFGVHSEHAACLDGLGRINVAWVQSISPSTEKAYFSRLDRYGNTLVDDYLLRTGTASIGDVAVGCDDLGNAHVIWRCPQGLCQARFDAWGYPVILPSVAYDQVISNYLALDLDSQGNAHAFFRRSSQNVQIYARFNTVGEFVLGSHSQLSGSSTNTIYRDIALDTEDNVHLMWYELNGLERVYYSRLSASASPAISDTLIGYTGYDGTINSSREPSLSIDPDGNAFILYPKYADTLYLDKIAPDGSFPLDDHESFPEWKVGGYTPKSEITLDQHGNLHLFSITDFGGSVLHSAYGNFDNDGNPLYPMRWLLYGNPVYDPNILVDTQDDIHFIYRPNYPTSYPSCPDKSVCYQGTGFEATTYDLARSDLGIDAAHLSWYPLIFRWNQSAVITSTVFNAGWVTSTATTLRVDIEVTTGTVLGPPAQVDVAIPALAPHKTHIFTTTLSLPAIPPAGLEELEYLRLLMNVDPDNLISETTESNNNLSLPILVQKLPTVTGLFLMVRDDTDTARGGSGQWIDTGTASIEGGKYSPGEIPVKGFVTILGKDIPVTSDLITYTIGWEASGYTTPDEVDIGVMRNPSDAYIIDFHSSNTAVMVTDRWGSLSGVISKSDGGGGVLEGVKVRLVGQGLSIEATTNTSGAYSSSNEPKLAKLIPGNYFIRLSRAGYERVIEKIVIDALGEHDFSETMQPTTDAYIHGNVINNFGNPVVNATVNACGSVESTDAQGSFTLVAPASCTTLQVSRSSYATLNEPISLTAGLELILNNLTLEFHPPLSVFSASNKVGSRIIDQSTGGLLPEPPPDANWLQKQVYEQFKSKFWPEFKIYIVYGGYAYNAAAGYSGASDDRRMNTIQINLVPKTFEIHMLLTTVNIAGAPIPVPLVNDSGDTTAIWVVEARLVNTATGQVIKTVYSPLEGSAAEIIIEDTTLTYDFNSQAISDWANTEVWLYYKIGKNVGGSFVGMPGQLYQHDRQIMKFDLDQANIWIDYGLGPFPLP